MKGNILVILILILSGCAEKREIKITNEYVISDYWPLGISSSFTVERQKIKKDSTLNIFLPTLKVDEANAWRIINNLERDTTFVFDYSDGVSSKIPDDTVYFYKKNIGRWYKMNKPFGSHLGEFENIGRLEKNTWYKFTDLRESYYHIYIFIDSIGQVRRFNENLANF
jgi:hypothetical protein